MARGKRISSMSVDEVRASVNAQQKKIETLDSEIAKLDTDIKAKRKERNQLKVALNHMMPKLEEAEQKAKEAAEVKARKADAEKIAAAMAKSGKSLDEVLAMLGQ